MKPTTKRLMRSFGIEIGIYGIFLIFYFFFVLRFLERPLTDLFQLNAWVYAGATLILIFVQSVFLERVTTWLIRALGLERVE